MNMFCTFQSEGRRQTHRVDRLVSSRLESETEASLCVRQVVQLVLPPEDSRGSGWREQLCAVSVNELGRGAVSGTRVTSMEFRSCLGNNYAKVYQI